MPAAPTRAASRSRVPCRRIVDDRRRGEELFGRNGAGKPMLIMTLAGLDRGRVVHRSSRREFRADPTTAHRLLGVS
jgi:hypothetical protein